MNTGKSERTTHLYESDPAFPFAFPPYLHRHIRLSPGLVRSCSPRLDIAFPQEPPHPGQVGATGFLVLDDERKREEGRE